MRVAHASDAIILFPSAASGSLPCSMPERVITIALTDADWKALRAIQPEPVDWLKRTIRETIERAREAERPLTRAAGAH
jgi:hypothetical protein